MSEYVLTLVADARRVPLKNALVLDVARALGVRAANTLWLEDEVACDIFFTLGMEEEMQEVNPFYLLRRALRSLSDPKTYTLDTQERWQHMLKQVALLLRNMPIDAIVQQVGDREKKLFISDMDSTMITVECIDELADFVGKKDDVSKITELAMNGELDFEQALISRVGLLRDLSSGVLEQCYRERITMSSGAKTLVQTLHAEGVHTVLVSGGFTFFTERVSAELGFHEHHANILEVENDLLTGTVREPILGKEAKVHTMLAVAEHIGCTLDHTLALGDGANDVPMLRDAGLGVAYRAKPHVRDQIAAQLNHVDLTALLHVMGIPRKRWVES